MMPKLKVVFVYAFFRRKANCSAIQNDLGLFYHFFIGEVPIVEINGQI